MAASDFFTELKESAKEVDLNSLDFENPGVWPLIIKVVTWVILFVAVIGLTWHFVITPKRVELQKIQQKEAALRADYEEKARKAANLEAYRKQMVEMEALFKALVSQLPSDTEVPGLLEDLSRLAEDSGLVLDSMALESEQKKEVFVELPIQLKMTGGYHDIGSFVSGVAAMPRIVTLHNFSIDARQESSELEIDILAKTYRFKREGE